MVETAVAVIGGAVGHDRALAAREKCSSDTNSGVEPGRGTGGTEDSGNSCLGCPAAAAIVFDMEITEDAMGDDKEQSDSGGGAWLQDGMC